MTRTFPSAETGCSRDRFGLGLTASNPLRAPTCSGDRSSSNNNRESPLYRRRMASSCFDVFYTGRPFLLGVKGYHLLLKLSYMLSISLLGT